MEIFSGVHGNGFGSWSLLSLQNSKLHSTFRTRNLVEPATLNEQNIGANDWRVPNIKELQSLNDFGASNPSVAPAFFSAIGVKKYWSSTTLPNQTTRDWFWDTQVGITTFDLKTASNYLICVRSNKAISTGIRQIDPELESVRISPNPAANEIILYFEGEDKSAVKSMTLSNALGQVARRINIPWTSKTFQINTNGLENGWYFLSLQKGEAIKTSKILIQH